MLKICSSIYTNPGAYALIIGSGLSTTAGIETAYGIQIQLAKEILQMKKLLPDPDMDPEEIEGFFIEKVGEFSYESLLRYHNETSTERAFCIKKFIEPTEEDKEAGRRILTESHNTIAKLVEKGYIKIIITPNFDRLIESALTIENINYHYAYNVEDLDKLLPLVHMNNCVIIKPNGDYLSTETKNLNFELDSYHEKMESYLSEIAKTYGIITFGWSVKYDKALKRILSNNPCKHFGSYITRYNSQWEEEAEELKNKRFMRVIDIDAGEDFFESILDGIESLEQLSTTEKKVNLETFKRFVVNPSKETQIYSLITNEIQAVKDKVKNIMAKTLDHEYFKFDGFELLCEATYRLSEYLAWLSYIDIEGKYSYLATRAIESLSSNKLYNQNELENLWNIPSTYLTYVTGICCLKRYNYSYLKACLLKPSILMPGLNNSRQKAILLNNLTALSCISDQSRIFEESSNMYRKLKEVLIKTQIFNDEEDFTHHFLQFQLVFHTTEGFQNKKDKNPMSYSKLGGITYHFYKGDFLSMFTSDIIEIVENENSLLKFGFYDGKIIIFFKELLDLAIHVKKVINSSQDLYCTDGKKLDELIEIIQTNYVKEWMFPEK